MNAGNWAPPVDVAEESDKILVRVEVPGMNEQDLKVNYEDGLLTVSGERQFEKNDDRNYHRIERGYGSFVRSRRAGDRDPEARRVEAEADSD